ncbi:unnamed protein product [Polarella glacialis]|uniref:Uncharacterized protein n=1 Tax=Polarella glacialis TaxID=89957 RepID=A0A813I1A3_POLGL|nr:unnamed protein product [Polarella glacialis]
MACAADSLSSRRRSSRSLCALAAVAATIASIAPAFTGVGCSWRRSSQHLVARGSASEPFPIWEDDIDISRTVRELLAEAKPPEEAMRQAAVTWPGLWRVVQAPHLRSIGSVALTRVDVYYDIATQGNPNRLWDVRCHMEAEEAEEASKVCVSVDPPKKDRLGTRFSLVKFRSARRRKMSG